MTKFTAQITENILFPEEKVLKQSPEKRFSETLRNKILYKQAYDCAKFNPELAENLNERMIYDDIADFMRAHVKTVGKEQAIKDFQCGLNLLTGYKKESVLEEQNQLNEDAEFSEKTFNMLKSVLEYYPIEAVKKYIKLGAANNCIWNTKNIADTDSNKEIEEITKNLDEGDN